MQSDKEITFGDFKTKLRSYESTEKFTATPTDNNVMKASGWVKGKDKAGSEITLTCYNCGLGMY